MKKEINIDKQIVELKKSPMFNLSLSSKELFHSNFIAWLAYEYPEDLGKIFAKILNIKSNYIIDKESILRESKNIDLSFRLKSNTEKDEYQIIIENKVKDLPYLQQLTKYSKKYSGNENVFFLLLSLSRPEHLITTNNKNQEIIIDDNKTNWIYLNYESFTKEILKIKFKEEKSQYHKQLICDYAEMLQILVDIDKYSNLSENDKLDFYEENTIYDILQKSNTRLHSYFIKRRFENFANKIFKEIENFVKNHFKEKQIPVYRAGDPNFDKAKGIAILVNNSINFSKGVIPVYIRMNSDVYLAIELDGYRYFKGVNAKNKEVEVIADNLFNKEWFHSKHIPDSKKRGKTPEEYKEKGYNRFKGKERSHLYIPNILLTNNSIADILSYFITDIKIAVELYDELYMQKM